MLYRKMPKNGDDLSILGFGCMRLPLKEDGTIDEERATKQLRYAIDHGVNYIETAWNYHMGNNEPFIGRMLADGYRDKVKLATKLPSWLVESREDMDKFLNAQLERLKTDHIDYYLIHSLDGSLWDKVEKLGVANFLDRAKADGKIINVGFSFHDSIEKFKDVVNGYNWDFCQIQYNYFDEKYQAGTEGLKYAAEKGLGVIIMEPLRGGTLSKMVPPSIDKIWDEAKEKRTPAEWAFRWIWSHPEVTIVLSGMNEEAHIEENLRVANEASPNSLTEAELYLIKKVGHKYHELMKVGCTGCRYCMPCPEGVNIPACLEAYNYLYMFGNIDDARNKYATWSSGIISIGKTGFASQCIQCNKCVKRCPQQLKIPDILEHVVDELEGPELQQNIDTVKNKFNKGSKVEC
ncbi:aldo/keto reductase [Methanosarcina sp.]|uniref:aldo/keto reductase n=1 Tax=Methanosarcina sp. TaxID=2213 RepID=UPI003BB5CBE8